MILIILLLNSTMVSAENIYPLEDGEIVQQIKEISENEVIIFSQIDNQYYKKTNAKSR